MHSYQSVCDVRKGAVIKTLFTAVITLEHFAKYGIKARPFAAKILVPQFDISSIRKLCLANFAGVSVKISF